MGACAPRREADRHGKLLREYKTPKKYQPEIFNRRAVYLVIRGLGPCRSNKEDFKAIEKNESS
jgi:hypothetical protein